MTAGFVTHAQTFGRGNKQALAIHCTLAHSGAWRGVGDALHDQLTLTAFDLPGHGKSPDWDHKTDLHELCRDAALAYLPRPRDLIGHSFGATVALRLAVEHPDLVRSLTLIEPVFFAAVIADAPERMAAHDLETAPITSALVAEDHARAAQLFNRFWGDGTKWDAMSAATRRYLTERMTIVPGQSAMIFEDNAGLMAPGKLARAKMPCLLIVGAMSPDIIDAIHSSLAHRLPNAMRATIAGAGHMSPLTHPNEVASLILRLIEVAEE